LWRRGVGGGVRRAEVGGVRGHFPAVVAHPVEDDRGIEAAAVGNDGKGCCHEVSEADFRGGRRLQLTPDDTAASGYTLPAAGYTLPAAGRGRADEAVPVAAGSA